MTLRRYEGRCPECGHDHDAENEAFQAAISPESETAFIPVAVLREHWLHQIECDHQRQMDRPICACSRFDLGWHPSVGAAVEAWLSHLTGVVAMVESAHADEHGECPNCSYTYPLGTDPGHFCADHNPRSISPSSAGTATSEPYQLRVDQFMLRCFGFDIAEDTVERNHRFLEESLELVQALGCTADDAHMLVDYVYGRPTGQPHQEAGGVMVTLAALCTAAGLDMTKAGEDELARVFGKIDIIREKQSKIDIIREKQKSKPKGSPLPQYAERVVPSATAAIMDERTAMLLAAISTACLQNTRESAKARIGKDNPYWTQAYGDACAAVDREMAARERAEAMLEECAKFIEAEARSCMPGSAADDQNWGFALQSTATKMRRDLMAAPDRQTNK